VPEYNGQLPRHIPDHLRVAKIYYKPDLEAVQNEEINAKLFGEGAAHEWHQGLTMRGKDAMADANRWARWEKHLRAEQQSAIGFSLAYVLKDRDSASFQHPAVQSRDTVRAGGPASSVNFRSKSESHVQLYPYCLQQVAHRPET
jgi:hypothetical protein